MKAENKKDLKDMIEGVFTLTKYNQEQISLISNYSQNLGLMLLNLRADLVKQGVQLNDARLDNDYNKLMDIAKNLNECQEKLIKLLDKAKNTKA
jgi:hypothetical protein